ncbi:hypothetical protein PHMEG_0007316 [Phytophthora megakarya]|uniref:Uncharacterized protein n=1 Tax=Phytophthora megakarya TaxID=4795 RepID=A0A225WLY1_9STRA|nr:hypothetical protein PHMEG_0007316 [Phytophthora megakarya]
MIIYRTNCPEITYNLEDIARPIWEFRVHFPGHPILVMLDDVYGALSHNPVSAEHVHMFAFGLDGYLGPRVLFFCGTHISNLYEKACLNVRSFLLSHRLLSEMCGVKTTHASNQTRLEANLALQRAIGYGPRALNERNLRSGQRVQMVWD